MTTKDISRIIGRILMTVGLCFWGAAVVSVILQHLCGITSLFGRFPVELGGLAGGIGFALVILASACFSIAEGFVGWRGQFGVITRDRYPVVFWGFVVLDVIIGVAVLMLVARSSLTLTCVR